MNKQFKLFAILTFLLIFSITFYQWCSMIALLTWTICGIIASKSATKESDKLLSLTEIAMLLFFAINAISILFSFDKTEGLTNLQSFLPFAIIPLMASLYQKQLKDNYIPLLRFFVLGAVATSLICLVAALVRSFYITDGSLVFNPYIGFRNQFVYTHLSIFLYTNTFAMCIVFTLAILIWELLFRSIHRRWPIYLGIALCILMIFLLSSRTNVYALFAVLYFSVLVFYLRFKKLIHSIIMLIAVTGLFWIFQNYNYRVLNLSKQVTSYITEEDIVMDNGYVIHHPQNIENVNIRFQMWETGIKLLRQYWITGCGIGDYKNVLRSEYQFDGIDEAYQKGYDQHNQYIETFATTGIIGGFLLLTILILALISAIKYRNYLLCCCLLLITLNMMLESMLNRFSASLFFVVAILLSMQTKFLDGQKNSIYKKS